VNEVSTNVEVICKKCGSEKTVKSGVVGGRQRFRCKGCGCNFRLGDNRTDEKIAAKKALCILWYAMGKGSYRMMGRILNVDHSLVYRWIRDFGKSLAEPKVSQDIKEIEFDEVWHFVGCKKTSFGFLKQLIVLHEERLPGFLAGAILQHLDVSTKKLDI
jgi:transposase